MNSGVIPYTSGPCANQGGAPMWPVSIQREAEAVAAYLAFVSPSNKGQACAVIKGSMGTSEEDAWRFINRFEDDAPPEPFQGLEHWESLVVQGCVRHIAVGTRLQHDVNGSAQWVGILAIYLASQEFENLLWRTEHRKLWPESNPCTQEGYNVHTYHPFHYSPNTCMECQKSIQCPLQGVSVQAARQALENQEDELCELGADREVRDMKSLAKYRQLCQAHEVEALEDFYNSLLAAEYGDPEGVAQMRAYADELSNFRADPPYGVDPSECEH